MTALEWRWAGTLAAIVALVAVALVQPAASPQRPDLPSPSTGWLIISGPVNRAGPCGLTHAYNVATGAAFVHDACADRAISGRLPPAAVREVLAALLTRVQAPWMPGPGPVRHTWRWVVSENVSLVGDVPWLDPDGTDAKDAAAGLVRAAAASLIDACAPPLPPPSLVLGATLPRMVNPVSADASQELTLRYRAARERWAGLMRCFR